MVKHIQIICRQKPTNCLSVFEHFVGLALKGLIVQSFRKNLFLYNVWVALSSNWHSACFVAQIYNEDQRS